MVYVKGWGEQCVHDVIKSLRLLRHSYLIFLLMYVLHYERISLYFTSSLLWGGRGSFALTTCVVKEHLLQLFKIAIGFFNEDSYY